MAQRRLAAGSNRLRFFALAMYHTVLMTEGEIKSLAKFDSYSAAEEVYDDFCDKYPNGWVEILSEADFQISQ